MPMRRGKKHPRRVRKGRGRRRIVHKKRHNVKATIDRMPGKGFADSLFVKLCYVDRIRITSSAVSYMPYVFRGNSVFDPDYTGTGHQPLYYDQYGAIYNRYCVAGSAIQLDVINDAGGAALQYTVEPSTNVSTFTDISAVYEQSRAGAPKIVPIAARVSSRFKRYASTRQVSGLTKIMSESDAWTSSIGNNPSENWFWNILFQSMDGSSAVDGYFVVKLIYYVHFYDRITIGQS